MPCSTGASRFRCTSERAQRNRGRGSPDVTGALFPRLYHDSVAELKSAVQVDTQRKPGSEVVLTIEVPTEEAAQAIERALGRLAARTRLPGFRPGKAPLPLVERQLGWPAIRDEALDALLPGAYQAALQVSGLEPVDDPRFEILQLQKEQPFRFRATVSVKPEVDLGDYASIRVAKRKTVVEDAQVEQAIARLRERFAELQVLSDLRVEEHDVVTADLLVLEQGVPVVGEHRPASELEVSREDLLPGLADALIGAAVGDVREAVVTLPEDHARKELAGRSVTYRMTVKDIKRKVLPAEQELPRLLGRGESLEELRKEVRQDLEAAAARADAQHFESEVLRQLAEKARVEVPIAMVEREIDRDLREFETRLGAQGIKLDRYLAYTNQTVEVLRAERRPLAQSKVRVELALEALAAKERIQVTEEELSETVQKTLASESDIPARRRELAQVGAVQQYLRRQLTLQKAAEYICTLAAS